MLMKQCHRRASAWVLAIVMTLHGSMAVLASDRASILGKMTETRIGVGNLEGTLADRDVFNVVLPVIPGNGTVSANTPVPSAYDFIVDPKGVAADKLKEQGKKVESGVNLYFQNKENSSYDYSSTSDAFTIRNRSTMNVDVELEASLTGMDDIKLTSDSSFANSMSASIYLALRDNKGGIMSNDVYGAFLKTTLKGQPDAYEIIYDPTNDKYKYQMKSDAALAADKIVFDDYTFRLNGACNLANNWSKLSDYATPTITVTWIVKPRPESMAPSIGKTFYVMEKGRDIRLSVDLGAGDLGGTGITSITAGATTLSSQQYALSGRILTIKGSYVTTLMNQDVTSQEHIITFNDKAKTQIAITLTSDNVAPSIENDSYSVISGQDVAIEVDLGSGSLGATGIKSILAGGGTVTATNYSFANGILTIKGSYITAVLKKGEISREHTIIFNNKDETAVKFTLTASGTLPDISNKSYEMTRDTDLSVSVELGTGTLGATGIKSILAGSGTVAASNYTLENGTLTFKSAYINAVLNKGEVSREHTIIFNDIGETRVKILFTAKEARPTINAGTYTMVKDTDVMIGVDLGSGTIGATGIKSILAGGGTVTPTNYTLAGNKLIMKGSYITAVLKKGEISREHTIVFNDKAETSVKFTLVADGTLPSTGSALYTMFKDQDLVVDVDLGTGTLAATGIKSILAGAGTMSSTNYTFANGKLTIKGSYITAVLKKGEVSREHTIVFNNIAETKVKITLAADGKAPTVRNTSYTMVSGRDVVIDVDLGTGTLGATTIKSILAGAGTVTTTNYTFANGKLTMKGSYITAVLRKGETSREHTIVFDDVAETRVKVVLRK